MTKEDEFWDSLDAITTGVNDAIDKNIQANRIWLAESIEENNENDIRYLKKHIKDLNQVKNDKKSTIKDKNMVCIAVNNDEGKRALEELIRDVSIIKDEKIGRRFKPVCPIKEDGSIFDVIDDPYVIVCIDKKGAKEFVSDVQRVDVGHMIYISKLENIIENIIDVVKWKL